MNTSPKMALLFSRTLAGLVPRASSLRRSTAPNRSGPCRVWIKVRIPASIAVQRERSENWNR
jgi:hypothetical protein